MTDLIWRPIREVAEVIRGVTFSKTEASQERLQGFRPVLRAGNIQEDLLFNRDLVYVPSKAISQKQLLRVGDIVMCTSSGSPELVGKTAYSDRDWDGSFGTFCAGIRAKSSVCDSRYLFHYLRSPIFRSWTGKSSGANIKNIRKSELEVVEVPLPPLRDQKRIAQILDKAELIHRKRNSIVELADGFCRSVFLDMFGDPVTNPNGLSTQPLSEIASFVSGGTPSKSNEEYWSGTFPWVSPKDMKKLVIDGAEDHISEAAFQETNLKKLPPNVILIVVRGMILAHTVPIGITGCEVAINQDIKGIIFDRQIEPEIGLWSLKVQHANLLTKIDTAAHGTKRFDMDRLGSIPVIVPSATDQKRFIAVIHKFSPCLSKLGSATEMEESLSASLTQRAFSGEL